MKQTIMITAALLLTWMCCACSGEETYAKQKQKEKETIDAFLEREFVVRSSDGTELIRMSKVQVISEAQFVAQDSTTDVSQNQYVRMSASGVYMQILNKGVGDYLKNGESQRLACRFLEYNISADSVQTSNWGNPYVTNPEMIDVSNDSGTFTATFATDVYWGSTFNNVYGSTSVPSGWILAMRYVRLGNAQRLGGKPAHVRLIVPHSAGQANAMQNVYACFYDLTFEEEYK